jgi:hypothetical protein
VFLCLEEVTGRCLGEHCRQQYLRLPRLQLTDLEYRRVADILQSYLVDKRSIVKTFAMQGLADLTGQCPFLHPTVIDLIRTHARTGIPAVRARGRKLLQKLEHQDT